MLHHFLKTAFRNFLKNRTSSFINVVGLSLGFTCVLLILFHVRQELSYDKGFSRAGRIFRITQEDIAGSGRHWAATAPTLSAAVKDFFPEVEKTVRFQRPYPSQLLSSQKPGQPVKRFEEKGGLFADPQATTVFDLPFIEGNGATALDEINSIVITRKMAQRYFGNEPALGKTILDDNRKIPYKVTGVVNTFQFPTHLAFDYLLSMSSINAYFDKGSLESRTWSGFYTYALLAPGAKPQKVESRFNPFMLSFYAPLGESGKEILSKRRLHLQPISSIHLHSKLEKELSANSDITYVYIFSFAALLILAIAVVNFVNMSTAYAFRRLKEIGVRKVSGATRKQLFIQFLGESLVTTLIATALSLLLLKAAIPLYNELAGKNLVFQEVFSPFNLLLLVLFILLVSFSAAIYPAFIISSQHSLAYLKGKPNLFSSSGRLRKGLVVFQFAVSVFMIFCTLIIYRQLKLFHEQDLGFDKDQVAAITIYGDMREQLPAILDQLRSDPAINYFSAVSTLPGERYGTQPFSVLHPRDPDEQGGVRVMWADEQLLPTLDIPLKDGKNFERQFPDIKRPQFILNEATVKAFGLTDPVGETFILDQDTGTVVGVVKDFNFASLHAAIEPLVIKYDPYQSNYLLIKGRGNRMSSLLDRVEGKLKAIVPSGLFTYHFLDSQIDALYESENRMNRLFQVFALFSIFISCLGLYGLSAYAAELRTKEIGIRKVLGATVSGVTMMLTRDYIKLVLIGMIIAFPVGYWAMEKWLSDFAYRTEIRASLFFLSGIFTLFVALITVSFQGIRAAVANPADSLRTE